MLTAAEDADVLLMAAAVADFKPADYAAAKIKKTDDGASPVITLQRNPDILADTVQQDLVDPAHRLDVELVLADWAGVGD